MDSKPAVKKSIAEAWTLRVGPEWGVFMLNEATGTFCAQTTFGNYAYTWTRIGEQTLKAFLIGLSTQSLEASS